MEVKDALWIATIEALYSGHSITDMLCQGNPGSNEPSRVHLYTRNEQGLVTQDLGETTLKQAEEDSQKTNSPNEYTRDGYLISPFNWRDDATGEYYDLTLAYDMDSKGRPVQCHSDEEVNGALQQRRCIRNLFLIEIDMEE